MGNFKSFEHGGRSYVTRTHESLDAMVIVGLLAAYNKDIAGIMTNKPLVKSVLSRTTSRDADNKKEHDLSTEKGVNKHFQGRNPTEILELVLKVCTVNGFFALTDTSTETTPSETEPKDVPTEE